VRLRTGRHLNRTIYVQLGDEPSDDDELLGLFLDPQRAAVMVAIANGDQPPLSTPGGPDGEPAGPAGHEHYWMPEALCVPPERDRARVMFRCGFCPLLAYGQAAPDEIREP